MVSGEKVWDPLHAGLIQPRLNEQHLAARITPLCVFTQSASKDTTWPQSQRVSPLSSPPLPSAASDTVRRRQTVSFRGSGKTKAPRKAVRSLSGRSRADEEEEEGEAEQLEMKGKRHGGRGEAMMEERLEDMVDGPKNAKITLSFPLSAGPLPASLTSPSHCRSSASSSPSPHRRRPSSKSSDEGSLWKLDSTMDVKHRPFKPPRHDSSPSSSPSSSSSPMTVHTLIRKDIKSPPPLKCSKLTPETPFHKSPPRCPGGSFGGPYGGDGWDERQRLGNGTAASPSQTAQILFSLGASAFQRGLDVERKEKITGRPAGKLGSPHGPSLHPPTLHLPPPLPPPPPPPSEGLTAPPHSSSYPPTDSLKPELICGVCHRLFSSASSLTVHMRLHRGSRALSCRFCGKVFIHSKRLQSHEASCRVPGLPASSSLGLPPLGVQPKEEPLEEGEVRVEGGVIVGETDISKARPGKKARSLLARIQGDDAAATELLGSDESHFVKVVDGNVIYFCSVCERSYMTLSSLKRHSNVHSWRRKYPCHYCDKVFALAEYRTKHEVWHTGERRYQCIFCWDAFATYYNLKTHQKTIHGINPSLISSEKTANGGYKQKANALKLYRLLPMRSQKRPYKTYSDSLHNGLLIPPTEAPSLPLPGLGCALGPGDLQSLISGAHAQSVKPDPDAFPDGFPVSAPAEHRDLSALAPLPQTDMPHVRKHDSETQEQEQSRGSGGGGSGSKMCSSSKTKTPKAGRGGDAGMPSVITYGHTKPSVIVHGTAVSSSVIVHSNQLASGREGSPSNSLPPENGISQPSHKGSPKSVKKQRDSAENHRKRSRDSSDTTDEGSRGRQDGETGRSLHKSHRKGDTSNSKQPPPAGSQVKEAGPLCQITVRIGEEAIVKRSISETDLRRDKSHSPPKTKRGDASSAREAKELRHSHSHHHHKHRIHHRIGQEAEDENKEEDCEEEEEEEEEEVEGGKKSSKSRSEVREYYFRQGVREQDSDHDTEDNLWRPYYSYKPKKKAQAHLQRVKCWQRKLKFKRSIRLKRRAERLKNHVSKEAEKSQDEEEEEEDGKAEEDGNASETNKAAAEEKDYAPSKDKSKEAEQVKEVSAPPLRSPQPPLSTSAAGIKRRPWTNGNAAECGTCGRWFSSPRKRDKHELSHLLEFVCLFCRATFPSRDKLEDHQRAQHPKPAETPPAPPKAIPGEQHEGGAAVKSVPETAKYNEEKGSQVALVASNSCPTRLSRRALSRHTCPQCHKVCKTSSALTRHIRRHELSSSPEREKDDKDSEEKATEAAVDRNPEAEKVPSALSVPVISYSTPDPPESDDRAPSQPDNPCEQTAESHDKAQVAEVARPASEPSPKIAEPPSQSPVNPTPPKPELAPATPPNLQSVLVMNGSECLDYRTPSKKSLDGQIHRIPSPAQAKAATIASPNVPMTSQTRITTATPPVSMTTVHSTDGGFMKRDGVIMDRERKGGSGVFMHAGYEEPPRVQDLRIQPLSRSPSPDEAQDLTMSSILAREREIERREKEKELERQRERERDKEKEKERQRVAHAAEEQVALLVPKEEPLSPVPSPQPIPTQTTMNGPPSHRHTPKSPCHSAAAAATATATATGLLAQTKHHVHSSSQGLDRLPLPTGAAGAGERPSAHALLLPRAPPPPEPEQQDTVSSRDSQQGEAPPMGYPAQDYPLPLIVPDSYHSGKKQEENLFMSSYPAGALPFGPLGKVMVPNGGDLAKLPFYPDPYQLLYGSQLLAYPYNLAALPVALNMMAPGGDKVEPLPFLPAIFNYAAAAGPYVGAAPHPLVANPSLYSAGSGSGKKQRDSSSNKP